MLGFAFSRQPDRQKPRALGIGRRRDGEFRDLEAGSLKPTGEGGCVTRAGDRKQPALLKRLVSGGNPAPLVHPWPVARSGGRGVEVEEDGVQQSGMPFEAGWAAIVFQGNPFVGDQRTFGKVGAMPVRQDGERFGDNQVGALLRQFAGNCGEHVAEAKAREPDLWLPRRPERGAGKAREFFLGGAGGWTANLLAMDEQGHPSVVFLEGQGVAIRKFGFCESGAWFHGPKAVFSRGA